MVGSLSRLGRAVTSLVLAALVVTVLPSCSGAEPSNSAYSEAGCTRSDLDGRSVARVWDETVLELIRQVVPAPTVHARNLFHVSAAMWDAWAAYDPTADGYFVTEKHTADDVLVAREVAMSYAAYRILLWRYAVVSDLSTATDALNGVMKSLCLRIDVDSTTGNSPAEFGNRIAQTILDRGAEDGSLEEVRYEDSSYRPTNAPMVVSEPGTELVDPNAWQPLSLGLQLSQNGLLIPGNVQTFIGPHWGKVTPFALEPSPTGTPIDPGAPPRLGDPETDAAFTAAAVAVIRYSAELDPTDGVTIDIGPGTLGNNTLGSNDGNGHDVNPVTGDAYASNTVLRADFARSIAEFWADGPTSETPPGHWNVIANAVQDAPGFERRIGGEGPVVDPLEWDVKTYFALNGALHDAAIAAWGLKAFYDSTRPISMIRYMGGKGQSTEPDALSYDPDGLPLVQGLIEVVDTDSSQRGQRHADLADHIGEVVVRAWLGAPDDPVNQTSGVGWVRAVEWVPYQRPTFVTPSFAGYVSGHSAFSRAAAEVLTAITGTEFFPGGVFDWAIDAGQLLHEDGPSEGLVFQWATYFDAADQAGFSRLYGGIHIPEDDLEGRTVGATCGVGAWGLAEQYYDGTAPP